MSGENMSLTEIAKLLHAVVRDVEGLTRTRQIAHSSIVTGSGEQRQLSEVIGEAAGVADSLAGVESSVSDLDAAQSSELMTSGEMLADLERAADEAHEGNIKAIEAQERVDEALDAATEAATEAAAGSAIAAGAAEAAEIARLAAIAAQTEAAAAQGTANTARDEATSKAAAAEAAAKLHADAQAEAAEAAAVAEASGDATAKAAAAEAAAKAAAALDASAKAAAAEAAAKAVADAAQATADTAVTNAATADGKAEAANEIALQNARYRLVDGETLTPPVGGFRVGAQRVLVRTDGVPYQIDRWSGTAWVFDQVLTGEVLVVGPNGVVRIADGQVAAESMAASFYYGREFYGSLFDGGTFRLSPNAPGQVLAANTGDSLTGWTGTSGASMYVNTSIFRSSPSAITQSLVGNNRFIRYTFPTALTTGRRRVSVWVRNTGGATVKLSTNQGATFATPYVTLPPDRWVKLAVTVTSGSLTYLTLEHYGGNGSIHVDDVEVREDAFSLDQMRISRDGETSTIALYNDSGESHIRRPDSGLEIMEMDGTLLLYGGSGTRVISGPSGIRFESSGPTAILSYDDPFNVSSTNVDIGETGIAFKVPVTTPGNVFDSKTQLDAWVAPDGTHAWVISGAREYVRDGGDWRMLGTPPGVIEEYAGATAPHGYLMCNGAAVSRTAYSALFDAIGTSHGAGNGTTTFNVPDRRGRVAVGVSTDTEFNAIGKTSGSKTHTLTTAQMPSHSHGVGGFGRFVTTDRTGDFSERIAPTATGSGTDAVVPAYGAQTSVGSEPTTSTAGSGSAHNNIQPSIAENFIIKF